MVSICTYACFGLAKVVCFYALKDIATTISTDYLIISSKVQQNFIYTYMYVCMYSVKVVTINVLHGLKKYKDVMKVNPLCGLAIRVPANIYAT